MLGWNRIWYGSQTSPIPLFSIIRLLYLQLSSCICYISFLFQLNVWTLFLLFYHIWLYFIQTCFHALRKRNTLHTVRHILCSSSFFFWILFLLGIYGFVTLPMLFSIWSSTPSAGQTYDPPTAFSEASLLQTYFEILATSPSLRTYLDDTVSKMLTTAVRGLRIHSINPESADTFTRGVDWISYSHSTFASSVFAVSNKDGTNTHPLLFYSALEPEINYRGSSAGIVGWSVMLTLMNILLRTDNPTHPLQHPVFFFFDHSGPTTNFNDLRNLMKCDLKFAFPQLLPNYSVSIFFPFFSLSIIFFAAFQHS